MKERLIYLNNKDILDEVRKSREDGKITEKLHLMLYELSSRIASKRNWSGYHYTEDFITTSYLKCVAAVDKINLEKENVNAFSYFTTICHYSNIDMIKAEKRQSEFKQIEFDNYLNMLQCEFNIIDNRQNFDKWDV